jgi:hypothetical protein
LCDSPPDDRTPLVVKVLQSAAVGSVPESSDLLPSEQFINDTKDNKIIIQAYFSMS